MRIKYKLSYLNNLIDVSYLGQLSKVTRTSNLEIEWGKEYLSLEFSPNNIWWKWYGTLLSVHRLLIINGLRLKRCSFPHVSLSQSNLVLGICRLHLRYSNLSNWLSLTNLLTNCEVIHQEDKSIMIAYVGPLSESLMQLLVNLVRPYSLELSGTAALSRTYSILLDTQSWLRVSGNTGIESDVIDTLSQESVRLTKNLVSVPGFLAWDRESVLDCLWSHWLRSGKVSTLPAITLNVSDKVIDWWRCNGYRYVEHPRLEYVTRFNKPYYQPLNNVELGYPKNLDQAWLDTQVFERLVTSFQNVGNKKFISIALRFKQKTLGEVSTLFQQQVSEMIWRCLGVKPEWFKSTLTIRGTKLTNLRLGKVYLSVTLDMDQLSFSNFYLGEIQGRSKDER